MEATMTSMHTNPPQEIIPPDRPVVTDLRPVEPAEPNSGMSAAGPLAALFVGLAIFALFVFGATRTEEGGQSQQAAAQQQQAQKQNPPSAATTGQSPQAQAQSQARGEPRSPDASGAAANPPQQGETTGASTSEKQDNPPNGKQPQ
jgi:hypothetical protein